MAKIIPTGFRGLPLSSAQLSLSAVLKCGQTFRWFTIPLSTDPTPEEYEYRLCLRDRLICLRQASDVLFYRSVFPGGSVSGEIEATRDSETLRFLEDYFQLDVDLVALYQNWGERDPIFKTIQSRFSGIRILRQDPWENLISFICSSNNNISRINKMVHVLCKHYSPALISLPDPSLCSEAKEIQTYHPFPPPSVLAAPEVGPTLRSLGFGYRADFIQQTAKMLVDKYSHTTNPDESVETWLRSLRYIDITKAREELLKLMGVGRKVADCVLLMSLDKKEVIPVDTHVFQIAVKYYGMRAHKGTSMSPKLYDEVNTKLVGIWGEYAGWAHSVLFTSDLRSFSSHGLSTPSPSSTPSPKLKRKPKSTSNSIPSSPGRPDRKASATQGLMDDKSDCILPVSPHKDTERDDHEDINLQTTSLADRVKRRRRTRENNRNC